MSVPVVAALTSLETYCRDRRWRGIDCFDGLNSPWLRRSHLHRSPLMRLVWTQIFKRSPLSLWRIARVPEEENPKALALFLLGMAALESREPSAARRAEMRGLADRLLAARIGTPGGGGWGYPFDWQSRAFFAPRGTPNIVATTFACRALLAADRVTPDPSWRRAAERGCRFVADRLMVRDEDGRVFFSYIPADRSRIYNATLLGARLLAEGSMVFGEADWPGAAIAAARGVAADQGPDGSWAYGPLGRHRWIDSFHTGYNLLALDAIARTLGTVDLDDAIAAGYRFYKRRFFRRDCAPRYYAGRTFPIDIHAAAVAIETFLALERLDPEAPRLARGVARWTLDRMRDPRDGHFYFQRHRLYTIRIPYMRWSQAWMYHALALLVAPDGEGGVRADTADRHLAAGGEAIGFPEVAIVRRDEGRTAVGGSRHG